MQATKQRDGAHARIYSNWLHLPTWTALSADARSLLVEILGRFRPGENGALQWSVRRAGFVINASKSKGARCLLELELNGWLEPVTNAAFGGKPKAATYRLAMFPCDVTQQPASRAYQHLPGESLRTARKPRFAQSYCEDTPVPKMGRDGFKLGTPQSQNRDTIAISTAPVTLSDALRKTPVFNAHSKKGAA